jgi:endogenous inhibitor of DNA gyrase (YacG/DUF329 family)
MTAITSSCLTCATAITVTARNPNRRYCSPRCRVADWHRHHDRPRHSTMDDHSNDVPNIVPDGTSRNVVPDVVPAFTGPVDAVPNAINVANGQQRCPHCRAPIAIIAILVPPTAAHVRTPEVITPTT